MRCPDGSWERSAILVNGTSLDWQVAKLASVHAYSVVTMHTTSQGTALTLTGITQNTFSVDQHFRGGSATFGDSGITWADGSVSSRDSQTGNAALLVASAFGYASLIPSILAKRVADVNHARISDGATALHVAAQYGHRDVVVALLAGQAVVDHSTMQHAAAEMKHGGATPLMICCENGHYGWSPLPYMPELPLHRASHCRLIPPWADSNPCNTMSHLNIWHAPAFSVSSHFNLQPFSVVVLLGARACVGHKRQDGATALQALAHGC